MSHVWTTNPDVYLACKAEGLSVVDLTDGVDGSFLKTLDRDTMAGLDEIAALLSKRLPDHFRHLARHIAQEFFYPLRTFSYIHRLVSHRAKVDNPLCAAVFEERFRPFFWDPPNIPPDVANAASVCALEKAGCRIEWLQEVSSPDAYANPLACNRLNAPYPGMAAAAVNVDVALLWEHGIAANEMFYLVRKLTESGLSFVAVPSTWNRYFRDIDLSLTLTQAVKSLKENNCFRNADLRALAGQSIWKSLVEDCVRRVEAAASYYALGEAIARAWAPKIVVQSSDIMMQNRFFAEAVAAHGAVPVAVWHGGWLSADLYLPRHRHAVGHLAVWSGEDRQILQDFRPGYAVQPVGSLREDLGRYGKAEAGPTTSAVEWQKRSRACVLVLNVRLDSLHNTMLDVEKFYYSWRQLLNWACERPDITVLIKKHPRADYEYLYQAFGPLPTNVHFCEQSLPDILPSVSVVLAPNIISTSILEAALAGRPVVLLSDSLKPWIKQKLLKYEGLAIYVESFAELKSQIDRLLREPEYFRFCAERAQKAAREILPRTGDQAGSEMIRWLQNFLKESREKKAPSAEHIHKVEVCRWLDLRGCGYRGRQNAPIKRKRGVHRANSSLCGSALLHEALWGRWPRDNLSRTGMILGLWRQLGPMGETSFSETWPYFVEAMKSDAANKSLSPTIRIVAQCGAFGAKAFAAIRRNIAGIWPRRDGHAFVEGKAR